MKQEKGLVNKASKDFLLSILAIMTYNGVLQLVIYPGLKSRIGADAFGTVLYLIAVISIMGAGFGTSASYSRMVAKRERVESNGDYNIFLAIVAGISLVVSVGAVVALSFTGGDTAEGVSATGMGNTQGGVDLSIATSGINPQTSAFNVLFVVVVVWILMTVTVMRYYADVEYRMNIRFVDYFFFFAAVSAGYLVGLGIFDRIAGAYAIELFGQTFWPGGDTSVLYADVNPVLGAKWTLAGISWVIVLLSGELFGIIYTVIRGRIFRAPFFERSVAFTENLRSAFYISGGNLISAIILNSDRLLLRLMVGAREVTVFYFASLIGKMVALLTTPLNGVIISYITGYDIKINRKRFGICAAALLAISLIGAAVCTGVSYVFVKIMYPDLLEEAKSLFLIANLGQLLYFLSGTLMVLLLGFSDEKLQMTINIIYAVLFVIIVLPAVSVWGISGMAFGLLAVNLLRFSVSLLLGLRLLKEDREIEKE
ncbi:MAG: hypothetical protein K6G10_09070 [Butyrivibrio sp.]|nr:hypothetical protein [Butyrivibrio sp.]